MELNSFIASQLQAHFKKLLIICTATASIYLIKRYLDKKKLALAKKNKRTIKEFPTIEEIQRFIEELPFNAGASGKSVTLKDLLGELSEFSEDEDWKELIASVHHMYKESPTVNDDTAMQAVIKQTKVPPTKALNTNRVTVVFVSGAKAAMVEIMIPIDPGLENPQMA
ncbi:hypothetical protein D910_03204 [Dendroctonus ponderosae]|uniref:Uncharacterized protein n=1 Tax=Dendroctonus ponderosae TaxID=77166 RepID=U4TW36_DENPD|nr:hypothetical protein D910_03204 [Dendroctonus ponderosae]